MNRVHIYTIMVSYPTCWIRFSEVDHTFITVIGRDQTSLQTLLDTLEDGYFLLILLSNLKKHLLSDLKLMPQLPASNQTETLQKQAYSI